MLGDVASVVTDSGSTSPVRCVYLGFLMRSASLTAIVLVVGVLLSTQLNLNASTEAATKFDGNWAATAYFPEYKDPSGPIAKAVTMNFPVEIKNGLLQGEWKSKKTSAWFKINGKIGADGTAILNLHGITGPEEYNIKDNISEENHTRAGKPYGFEIKAQFNGRHGTGKKIGVRGTDFDFVKE
jgi:hypothetical protein